MCCCRSKNNRLSSRGCSRHAAFAHFCWKWRRSGGKAPPLQEATLRCYCRPLQKILARGGKYSRRLLNFSLGEDQDVLARQRFQDLGEMEAFGLDLEFNFGDAHLMLRADGDGGVLLTVFEQDQAAVRFEGLAHFAEHALGLRKLMIDVDHQDEIERAGREFGIGLAAEDGLDVGEFHLGRVGAEAAEHFGLDVFGVDFAGGADAFGQFKGHVAGAGADVGDDHAGLETDGIESGFGIFLGFALIAVQPIGSADAHDGCDFAAAEGVLRLKGVDPRNQGEDANQ
jgi:hypothetical protein